MVHRNNMPYAVTFVRIYVHKKATGLSIMSGGIGMVAVTFMFSVVVCRCNALREYFLFFFLWRGGAGGWV